MSDSNNDNAQTRPESIRDKLPFYKNVITMLVIVEVAILLMYVADSALIYLLNDQVDKNGVSIYTSHADHIINLQMIAVGGAVAMFERLIPVRNEQV